METGKILEIVSSRSRYLTKTSLLQVFLVDIVFLECLNSGLQAVFASLYNNEIEYSVDNVVGIIAASSFFKLVGLTESLSHSVILQESVLVRCDEELIDYIAEDNVVRFLNISKLYGLKKVLLLSFTNYFYLVGC